VWCSGRRPFLATPPGLCHACPPVPAVLAWACGPHVRAGSNSAETPPRGIGAKFSRVSGHTISADHRRLRSSRGRCSWPDAAGSCRGPPSGQTDGRAFVIRNMLDGASSHLLIAPAVASLAGFERDVLPPEIGRPVQRRRSRRAHSRCLSGTTSFDSRRPSAFREPPASHAGLLGSGWPLHQRVHYFLRFVVEGILAMNSNKALRNAATDGRRKPRQSVVLHRVDLQASKAGNLRQPNRDDEAQSASGYRSIRRVRRLGGQAYLR
jgi:hypothetical protein